MQVAEDIMAVLTEVGILKFPAQGFKLKWNPFNSSLRTGDYVRKVEILEIPVRNQFHSTIPLFINVEHFLEQKKS